MIASRTPWLMLRADDLRLDLEREIKELDRQVKEAGRAATVVVSLEEKLAAQKKMKALESDRNQRRRALFDPQDEIDRKHDGLTRAVAMAIVGKRQRLLASEDPIEGEVRADIGRRHWQAWDGSDRFVSLRRNPISSLRYRHLGRLYLVCEFSRIICCTIGATKGFRGRGSRTAKVINAGSESSKIAAP